MDTPNQEIKYDRERPTVMFCIYPKEMRQISIRVRDIGEEYEISVNNHSKTLSSETDYKLYTHNLENVLDLVMSFVEMKDNIDIDLWAPDTEEQVRDPMLSIELHDLVYPKDKNHVEEQVKRMLRLCTNLYMTEYKHQDDEKL